jgi:hypothetical protein
MKSNIKKQKLQVQLTTLCDDVLLIIFSFCQHLEIGRYSLTSKTNYEFVENYAKSISNEVIFEPWTIKKALEREKSFRVNITNENENFKILEKKFHLVEDLDLEMDLEPKFDADPDRITKIKFDNYIDVDFVKTEPDLKNCQRFTKKMEKTFLSQLKKFRSGGFWSDLIYLFTNLYEAEEIHLDFTETIDVLPEYSFEFPVLKKLRSAKIHVDSFDLPDEDCFAYLFKIFSYSHLEILFLEVEYNFDVLPPPLFETKSLKVLSIFCMNQTDCTMDIPDSDFSNLMNSLVNLEEIYLDGCSHLEVFFHN